MFEINETSDFYIEFNSEEEIDSFQKYLDVNKIDLRWRGGESYSIKENLTYKYKCLHINPNYELSKADKDYAKGTGIKIIKFSEMFNLMTENPLLSWLKRREQ